MEEHMNIFKKFVITIPVKTPLSFGHNDNIFIESIDFNERRRNGIKINANTFIKLSKLDTAKNKVIANTEISFWDLDHTKDFVYNNFISQFTILTAIIEATGGSIEEYEKFVLDVVDSLDSNGDIEILLKKKKEAAALQSALIEGFKAQIQGKIGKKDLLFKCKMISNKKGYLQPADDIQWILPMDSEQELPKVASRERTIYEKSKTENSKAKPDATGNAPEINVASNSLDSI